MSLRCVDFRDPRNKKVLNRLASYFPTMSREVVKSYINSWSSENLKDDEDRFPTREELEEWIDKEKSTANVDSFKSDMEKISQSMNPITRRNRVNKITRMFSNRVTEALEAERKRLNQRIDSTDDFLAKRELIDELKNLSRFKIIKSMTPSKIFELVKEDFQVYLDATPEERYELELEYINSDRNNDTYPTALKEKMARLKAQRTAEAYQTVIDNWKILAEEACSNFAITEGVSMDINDDYIEDDENTDAIDETGVSQDDSKENKEEQSKEGWMVNVREVSSFSSLSNRVRRTISNIARLNNRNEQDKDDLGDTQYLEASYVHSVLIQSLRDMVSAEDMLPTLYKLAYKLGEDGKPLTYINRFNEEKRILGKLPWMDQIITALESDPRMFTSFYRAYRKDYLNYWIIKPKNLPDGSVSYKTMSINKSEGTAFYFDEWRDNYEYGNILDEDSLYNKDGEIDTSKAKVGLETVNEILGKFPREADREEEIKVVNDPETLDKLQKALRMLGISVDDNTLLKSINFQIDDARFPLAILPLLDNLRTIYYDINKGNDKIENGKPADLINIYGSAYNTIAEAINKVDEDAIESNVRQGDKMRYAHVNPSYATTLIKKLRGANYKQYIESEFKNVPLFYDSKHGWYNELIKDLYTDPEAREKLEHIVVLEFNRKEYAKWSKLDAMLVLINQFNSNPDNTSDGYTFYQLPMLSDSQSAEFIRCKRYVENYEEVIIDKFYNLVLQEINRIETVKKRYQQGDVEEIANYDIIKRKNKLDLGGAEFKFLPELNTRRYNENGELDSDGKYTITKYKDTLGTESQKEEFLKREIKSLLEEKFEDAMTEYKEMGLLERVSESKDAKYVHLNKYSEEGARGFLKNFFYNSMFAQSQIIQLMTTDLAYYSNLGDFQKRNKQVHAPAERLNTYATWNINGKEKPVLKIDDTTGKPRKERVIYLKDFEAPSLSIDEIEEALKQFPALTEFDRNVIIDSYKKKINVADAQAYRTLDSFRATQIMADMWSEEEETAYNNFSNGVWDARDFVVLWNTRKPFLYTQKNQSNQLKGDDEGLIKVPTQHKNSEMLLLTNAIFGKIFSSSPKLKALDKFMTENNIDVAEFESAVKDGKQGVYDINDANTEEEVFAVLNKHVNNPNYVHEFDYNDYGIQTATPEHGIDAVQLVGTQIRRLIGADINAYNNPDFKFRYGNREWTVEQWFNYYNAINVANVRLAFEAVDKKFSNIEEIERELLREVRSNSRYGSDLKDALTLKVNPVTKEKEFTIPLDDPAQTLRIQSLLNSIIKSKITKQQIQGGALIQASAYGLKNEPKLIFEYEGKEVRMTKEEAKKSGKKLRLKCMECYMPCPTEELYNLLLDPETHELDVNKKNEYGEYIVPRKYLEAIGYRVPTEDKYSMAPLRIIGFLPRQVGSVIILPRDITNIAGSDFDVDKMYVMFHTLNISKYDMRKARYYYEKEKALTKETFEQFAKGRGELADEILESDVSFKEWFKIHKEEYKATTVRVNNFRFEPGVDPNNKMAVYESAKKQTKEQRDSLMIDLMYSVLTNSDTLGKFLNPGGFDNQKKTARIVTILNSMSLNDFKDTYGSVENLKKMDLDELNDIVNKIKAKLNPLSPNTWVTLHQRNMAGAALIGIAANHNASHAIMQKTSLSVKDEYALTFNGNKYNSLHNILNEEGQYITRNVSGFLAAFVDNAKDPVAGDMNFNTITADIAFTLLRLGVPVTTVGLVLSQPVVKEVVDTVNNERLTIQEAINQIIKKYANLAGGESIIEVSSEKGINNYDFTDKDLAENILAAHNPSINGRIEEATFFKNQLKVAYMFSKLNTLASDLGKLTQATRADTQNGAAGPSVADDIIKIERVQDVLDDSVKDTYTLENVDFIGFGKSEEDIINSKLPILQAFFTYGIESTNNLLSKYFPQYGDTYQKIIRKFKGETKYNRLDVKTRNSIYNDIISYYLTQFPEFRDEFNGKKFTRTITEKDGSTKEVEISARDYYINDFPKEFNEFKEAHPELNIYSFFNRLKAYISADKYHATPTIAFTNVGSITPTQKEQYIKDWTTLLYVNDQTKEIARKLFIYNCFKGFGFSPSGFSHLASTILKLDNESYMRTLREVHGKFDSEVDIFFEQYILNHLDNRQLVPDVSKANGHLSIEGNPTGEIGADTTSFSVTLAENSSHDMRQFAHPYKKTNEIAFHNFVHFNIKGRDIYFKLSEDPTGATATYVKVQPLGLKNQFIEYQYGVSAEAMESVIGQAEDNGFVDPYAESNVEPEGGNPNDITRDSNYLDSLLDSFAGGTTVESSGVSSEVTILDKLAPNNTDDYTGKKYCGDSTNGYEIF